MILAMTMTPTPSSPVISTLEPRGGGRPLRPLQKELGSLGPAHFLTLNGLSGQAPTSVLRLGEEGCRKG